MQQRYGLNEFENTVIDGLIELFNARFDIDIEDLDITFEKHSAQKHLNDCMGMTCKEEWGVRVLFFTQSLSEFIIVACHEFVHVKQIIKEGLVNIADGSYLYKGEHIKSEELEYATRPWEKEAYELQTCFVEEYMLHFAPMTIINILDKE